MGKFDIEPEKHEFKYALGLKAKDLITGFTGIITYRAQYITGCDNYGLNPGIDDAGKAQGVVGFDEHRIKIIGAGVKLPSMEEAKKKKKQDGGPQDSLKRRRG